MSDQRTTSLTKRVVGEIILFKEHEVCYWLQWGFEHLQNGRQSL